MKHGFFLSFLFLLSSASFAQEGASLAPFPSHASSPQVCTATSPVKKETTESIETMLTQMKSKMEGDEKTCESLTGVFRSATTKNDYEISPIQEKDFDDKIPKRLQQIYSVKPHSIKNFGQVKDSGLMIEENGKWFWITSQSHLQVPQSELLAGYLSKNKKVKIEPFELNSESSKFKLGSTGEEFSLDALTPVQDFVHKEKRSISNAEAFLNNSSLRVPPEMYELLKDPKFVYARNHDRFTEMIDMIYQKALLLMNGDRFGALFLSLLTTDVRARGPCGARYGLRGRNMVPRSIFDLEKSTIVEPNHLDATQHFFGYALLRQISGGIETQVISTVSKKKDYYAPMISNYFAKFHTGQGGDESVTVEKDSQGRTVPMAGKNKQTERRDVDVARDLLFNRMGMDFGAEIYDGTGDGHPSSTINSSKYNDLRHDAGLAPARPIKPWAAYDPKNQSIVAYNQVDYDSHVPTVKDTMRGEVLVEKALSDACKRFYESQVCGQKSDSKPSADVALMPEKDVALLRNWCENGDNSETTMRACFVYKFEMQKHLEKIYKENHY